MTTNGPCGPRLRLVVRATLLKLVDASGREQFADDVAARVAVVMRTFGIPGVPHVIVESAPQGRAISVFSNGVSVPFPPAFLRRLWHGLAPAHLQSAAFDAAEVLGRPNAWLITCAEEAEANEDPQARAAIVRMLAQLVPEVMALQPSRLLTPEATRERLGGAPGLDLAEATTILRSLVDRGVCVADGPLLLRRMQSCREAGHSIVSTLEEIYARMRSPSLAILVNDRLFELLADVGADVTEIDVSDKRVDPQLSGTMSIVREHRLLEFRVTHPVTLLRAPTVGDGEICIRLNDRVGPPIPVPGSDELAISATRSELKAHGISARPLVDAVTGNELAAIRAQDADAVRAVGLLPVTLGGYVAAAFARAITPSAHRLTTIHSVEAELARVEDQLPSLVHGALSRFRLAEITRLLHELVREQISIRDSSRILNAAVRYAELPEDVPRRFADAIPTLSDRNTGHDIGELLAFVRAEIADRVCFDTGGVSEIGGGAPLRVFETDDAFEARADDALAAAYGAVAQSQSPDTLAALRDDVWRGLGASPPPEPVILTSSRIRRALRTCLAQELPGARVLSRSEIPAGVETQSLGTITCAR
jgi:hypothetical protein